MRVRNSFINVLTGIGSQVIISILGFISRSVFITFLGIEYLGINGLFTNILGMLSLAEAGIGSAIIYSLYKPVAENDEQRIKTLMKFYRNAYLVIGLIIFLVGLSLMPFLHFFTQDTSVENIHLIYFIILTGTLSSYFFAHKISLLNVYQKGYIVTATYSISSIITTCVRIGILYYTQNFIIYLLVEIIITISTSLVLSRIVNMKFPYLKNKEVKKLDKETLSNIKKNVKALVLHRIGGYAVFGTDNIIIASFISVSAVGLYSNYYMLINICRTFIAQIFDNISHSVGNLVASEGVDKTYSIFKVIMLCNFWIYSFFTIFLYIFIEPFIDLWIGQEFLMAKSVLLILMINFYVSGMRRATSVVKTTSGIFHEDRFAPFFEAAINLFASILLVKNFGITGVFIGTLISTLAVPFWIAPYLVYKKVFNKPVYSYFVTYALYTVIGIGTCYITSIVSELGSDKGIFSLILKGLICLLIPNVIYVIIFYRTEEFRYLIKVLNGFVLSRIKGKITKSVA